MTYLHIIEILFEFEFFIHFIITELHTFDNAWEN